MEPVSQQPTQETTPNGINLPQQKVAAPEIDKTPEQVYSYPKYYDYLSALAGIIFGVLLAFIYSGKYLLPDLPLSLIMKKDDIVIPPGIGFDYQSSIYKIPSEVFSMGGQIKVLSIDYSHIGNPPKDIAKLTELVTLRLKNSGVGLIPSEISNITMLETLDLGGNKIRAVPESLGNLTNLKTLLLYNNNIDKLPESIGSLTNLSTLDLHGNLLKSLPANISGLQNLKYLYLGGNPLSDQEKQRITSTLPNTTIFF